jgi:predicted lipoprotein with Yx(FWY)xxD motif
MLKNRHLIALGFGLSLILAACSSSGGSSAAPSAEAPSAAPPAAAATIALAETPLGTVIVDADGKTLYLFEKDTDGTSTCYEDCAAAWPPLLATGEVTAGEGLDASLLTTVDRTDGTKQVKYGSWPLYYFAADAAAGDTTGQAVSDVWWVVDATGAAIK